MSKTIERKVDHLTTPKPTKASVIVTTSWDDGHRLDTRLAELLQSYGLQATFYLAPQNREIVPGDLLDEAQVRELASHFEIGSHTLTHPVLTALDGGQIDHELSESRRVLQDMTGQAVESFCYPRGKPPTTGRLPLRPNH